MQAIQTSQQKILVVDDSPMSRSIIQLALKPYFEVILCGTLGETITALNAGIPDLMILDIHLSEGSGLSFFAEFVNDLSLGSTPVIFLTSDTAVDTKVMAFSLGAADYLIKPVDRRELVARVRARLAIRRSDSFSELLGEIVWPCFRIRVNQHKVLIQASGVDWNEVDLSPTEYKLLLYLVNHAEQTLSRAQILDAVWGAGTFITDRSVDRHMSSIRRKLKLGNRLQSLYSVGYMLTRDPKK